MPPRNPHPALVFAIIFVFIFLLHLPLLQLPYFWDEAGYYVPAARDILLDGSLIPHTTLSNAHPPLVLAWIALWWKAAGYSPVVARSAMLVISAFSLLGIFRLSQRAANTSVAVASTFSAALYPVFFAQSTLAQVDLAAAGFTIWGICAYIEEHPTWTAIWFSLAALSKETAIIAPAAIAGWELAGVLARRFVSVERTWWRGLRLASESARDSIHGTSSSRASTRILALAIPVLPLIAWYAFHYFRTGYVFGNPEFFRYNVAATLNPIRFLLALVTRLWQVFGYMHLWVLTLAMIFAMLMLPPLKDGNGQRARIAVPIQMVFLVVVSSYVVVLALIGGAVLARYMLPVVPLTVIVAVSTLRRRLRYWPAAIVVVAVGFVAAWFWNPPYGFSPEDNLAYRDYVTLHLDGERFLEARYPMGRTLTAWPASDELSRPWLGYVSRPVQVVQIEDFSLEQVLSAADFRANVDVALVFSTKYEPSHPLLDGWKKWEEIKTKFFGFHRDLPPTAIARILGGRVVFLEERKGQWISVIELERIEDARLYGGGRQMTAGQ